MKILRKLCNGTSNSKNKKKKYCLMGQHSEKGEVELEHQL